MKGSTAFEKILIAVLSVLLLAAVVAFLYLLTLYASPASPIMPGTGSPSPAVSSSENSIPLPTEMPLTIILTPMQETSTSSTEMFGLPVPSATVTLTRYVMDTPTPRPDSIPSHFLFGRPLDPKSPIWPLPEFRFGSGTNLSSRNNIHTGLDLLADYGTPVYALGSGTVIWEGYGIESNLGPDNAYGVAVTIKHDASVHGMAVYSIYAHLSVTHVKKGDLVNEGDLIGEIGLTGNTSGPHLHLEVRLGDDSSFVTRNPELYIRPLKGSGVLVARLLNTDGSNLYSQDVAVEALSDSRIWHSYSYAAGAATPDSIYKENLVITDLPAGQYVITIEYGGASLLHSVIIRSGEVSFFTFHGVAGFQDGLPSE